jgi:hypothetical protein
VWKWLERLVQPAPMGQAPPHPLLGTDRHDDCINTNALVPFNL